MCLHSFDPVVPVEIDSPQATCKGQSLSTRLMPRWEPPTTTTTKPIETQQRHYVNSIPHRCWLLAIDIDEDDDEDDASQVNYISDALPFTEVLLLPDAPHIGRDGCGLFPACLAWPGLA